MDQVGFLKMGRLSNISGEEAVKAFGKVGWRRATQKGSHLVLVRDGSRRNLTVPQHKELGPGLLRCLIRDSDPTVEAFLDLL